MADYRQQSIPDGHLVVMEADVADGHLKIEDTWQHIRGGETEEVTGSMLTMRTAYLNGALVKDPELAQRLWTEAQRT